MQGPENRRQKTTDDGVVLESSAPNYLEHALDIASRYVRGRLVMKRIDDGNFLVVVNIMRVDKHDLLESLIRAVRKHLAKRPASGFAMVDKARSIATLDILADE